MFHALNQSNLSIQHQMSNLTQFTINGDVNWAYSNDESQNMKLVST